MTIESPATYINQLNANYPEGGADRSTADDHLRLIKSTVKATFPAVTGPVTVTHTELNLVAGATKTLASVSALTVKYSLSISANTADIARISQTVSVLWAKVTSISALNTQYSLSISQVKASISALTTSLNSVSVVLQAAIGSVSVVLNADLRSVSAAIIASRQPLDAELTAIAGLTSAANKVPRFTGSGTAEVIDVAYGTYTPTGTAGTNVSGVTPSVCKYIRVGNIVTVTGTATVVVSGTGTVVAYLSLPIASAFDAASDLYGVVSDIETSYGFVGADTTNDRAIVSWPAGATGSTDPYFSFSYQIK